MTNNNGDAWDKWRATQRGEGRFDLPSFVSPRRMGKPSLEYCQSYPDYARKHLRDDEIKNAEFVWRDQPGWDHYYGSGMEEKMGQIRAYQRQKARENAEKEVQEKENAKTT